MTHHWIAGESAIITAPRNAVNRLPVRIRHISNAVIKSRMISMLQYQLSPTSLPKNRKPQAIGLPRIVQSQTGL